MKYPSHLMIVLTVLFTGFFLSEYLKEFSNDRLTGRENNAAKAEQVNSFSVNNALTKRLDTFTTDPDREAVERGKKFLLMKVGARIDQLNPFIARIAAMPGLDAALKNGLIGELNEEIKQFEVLKREITQSDSKQDVKTVADRIKTVWLKSSESVTSAESKIISLTENYLILEAGTSSKSLQNRIDSLKLAGRDTTHYERLLSAYNRKIEEAKQHVKSANEQYLTVASTDTEGEKAQQMKATDQMLKNAQKTIKEAYTLVGNAARDDFSHKYR